MAKETETKFEVTVTNRGPFKDFEKLFKHSRYVKDIKVKILDTGTKDLGKIYEGQKIKPHLKIIRRLLKEACDNVGLKWEIPGSNSNEYHIRYGYGNRIYVYIHSHAAYILIDDTSIIMTIYHRDKSLKNSIKEEFKLGDPDLSSKLETIFNKMNKGEYDV